MTEILEVYDMEGDTGTKIELDAELLEANALKGSQLISLRIPRSLLKKFEYWLKDYPGLNRQDGLRMLMEMCVRGRYREQFEAILARHDAPNSKIEAIDVENMEIGEARVWFANHRQIDPGYDRVAKRIHDLTKKSQNEVQSK